MTKSKSKLMQMHATASLASLNLSAAMIQLIRLGIDASPVHFALVQVEERITKYQRALFKTPPKQV